MNNVLSKTNVLILAVAAASAPVSWADNQELDCLIEPEMTVELGSSVDGIVDHIVVDKSDFIKRGEKLVALESSVEKAAVALARERAQMEDTIQAKKVTAAYTARQRERVRELHTKKAASGADKDQAETDAQLARLELETARNNKRLAELELARAEAALRQRTITSPVSGIVVDRYLNPGESVEDKPILKLAQIDPLRIEVIAPRELFGKVKKGMTATIFPEQPASGRYEAEVSVVDGIVDAASGTFGIRLTVPNADHKLFGGLRCRAQFALGSNASSQDLAGQGMRAEPMIVQAAE